MFSKLVEVVGCLITSWFGYQEYEITRLMIGEDFGNKMEIRRI